MPNFLKVDKEYFKLGLKPIELLIYSQIAEYDRSTGNFFMSDEGLAEIFNVSKSTVSRALDVLENKKLIERKTKNTNKGKERHIVLCNSQNDSCETANVKMTLAQESKCTLRNKQNDFIKDKRKEKIIKDNSDFLSECIESCNSASGFVF